MTSCLKTNPHSSLFLALILVKSLFDYIETIGVPFSYTLATKHPPVFVIYIGTKSVHETGV